MNCPSCGRENPVEASFCMACGAGLVPPAEPGLPSPAAFPGSSDFVGRQQEMDKLRKALDDALSGQGRLVMLVGEPGIGKTRIAQELATYAQARGAQTLWGRCYEEEGSPPYWPWIQSFRSFIQRHDAEQLGSLMGPGAADIAEIVSEIRVKLPDLPSPPALDPEQARFRLFDSITTFLKQASRVQPLVLALDDLHWADRSTLLLLEFIAPEIQEIPLLIIGAYRDVEVFQGHPLPASLGNLIRQQGFSRIPLGGLSQPEVRELLEATSGTNFSHGTVETIYGRSEGNPLFVNEITRMLLREGSMEAEAGLLNIPEGIRETIGRRLAALSQDCNRVLTTASVIGREFDFGLLRALESELTEDELLRIMDEALETHMINDAPGGRERYQFSHALIQETLSRGPSTSRKVRLHARIGEALEVLCGDNIESHVAALAHHFTEASPVTGPGKLARYSRLAGEQALAAYAWEEARAYFELALTAKRVPLNGPDPATDAETAALLFGLAKAHGPMHQRHQVQDQMDILRRAFEYYFNAGDAEQVVAVVEYPLSFEIVGHRTTQFDRIARSMELVEPGSSEAGRLLSRKGWLLGLQEGDYEGAREAFEQALAIAQRGGDLALETRTLATGSWVDYFHLHWKDALSKYRSFARLDGPAVNPRSRVMVHCATVYACCALGDLDGATRNAEISLEVAKSLRDRYWLKAALSRNEMASRLRGDWQSSRDFNDRGLALATLDPPLLSSRALLEHEVGNLTQGAKLLQQMAEAMALAQRGPTPGYAYLAMTLPMVARISSLPDQLEVAEEAAGIVLASANATRFFQSCARTGVALLAIQRGDASAAREQYIELESDRGTLLGGGGVIAADRLLGLLSQTIGAMDQAMAHFDDSLAFCRKAGYRPELAWTCHDYADALLQSNNLSDHAKAAALLDESWSISQELGMRPLMERVIALQERLESQPAKRSTYPDGLTEREVEVLRLIASGKSNPEIAEEFVVSTRTVTTHITNIFSKISAANRAEAATYAIRQGLL